MRKNAAQRGESKQRGTNENSAILPKWMDLQALTRYAAVSERTLRAWIHSANDPLPASRVKGKILVSRLAFDAWLAAHAVKGANPLGVTGGQNKKQVSECAALPQGQCGEFQRRLEQPPYNIK